MTYKVIIPPGVFAEIDAFVVYMLGEGAGSDVAERWILGVVDALQSLGDMPRRHPLAERPSEARRGEIRRMSLGPRLAYYRVDEDRCEVRVLTLRHGHRRPWDGSRLG
ncbi:MAG: type II toxin-antitoxin system RelE/ParE family toxin [Planctomycetota bacterium]